MLATTSLELLAARWAAHADGGCAALPPMRAVVEMDREAGALVMDVSHKELLP